MFHATRRGRHGGQRRPTFQELWDRGPVDALPTDGLSAAQAHRMKWLYFIMALARTRPLPAHVRADPGALATPLARETGWPHPVCLALVARMARKTRREFEREELDPLDP